MVDLLKWLPKPNSSHMIPPEGRPNPRPSEIDPESWQIAEQATGEVLRRFMPTVGADERRKDVISYVQKLLQEALGSEVFPFGSVPLRTYLPDGDVDVTTFSGPSCKEVHIHAVRSVLEAEQNNKDAEFEVKDVKFIDAEVKLIKCRVENIMVDISFDQIGGICTLCFLEQVDQILGKNHLFKRSIALIKAWCFYESRILGAYHGLISTYGLETLVIYIFNLFHASLDGPLAVLYKFLEYFSRFNWEKYGISLEGPFKLSSFPEISVESAANVNGGSPLLTDIILQGHHNIFSVPQKISNNRHQALMHKFLNIVDPLREHNNLGRPICKSNYYRIVSALQYGAEQLGAILVSPKDQIANRLNEFFVNTLAMNSIAGRPELLGAASSGLPVFNTSVKAYQQPNVLTTRQRSNALRKPPSSRTWQANEGKGKVKAVDNSSQSSNDERTSSSGGRCDGALLAISNLYQRANSHARVLDGMRQLPFASTSLELTGNFNLYVISLYYARWHLVFMTAMVETATDQSFAAQVWQKKMVDMAALQNTFSYMHANGLLPTPTLPNPASYPMHQPLVPQTWRPRPRGTGSYIPNPKYAAARNENLPPRLRKAASGNRFQARRRQTRANFPVRLAPFTAGHSIDPNVPVFRNASGFRILPDGGLQFVSASGGAVPMVTPKHSNSWEKGEAPASETSLPGMSSGAVGVEEVLQLRDDAEFPRLAPKRK